MDFRRVHLPVLLVHTCVSYECSVSRWLSILQEMKIWAYAKRQTKNKGLVIIHKHIVYDQGVDSKLRQTKSKWQNKHFSNHTQHNLFDNSQSYELPILNVKPIINIHTSIANVHIYCKFVTHLIRVQIEIAIQLLRRWRRGQKQQSSIIRVYP